MHVPPWEPIDHREGRHLLQGVRPVSTEEDIQTEEEPVNMMGPFPAMLNQQEAEVFEDTVTKFHDRLGRFMNISPDEPLQVQVERKLIQELRWGDEGIFITERPGDILSSLMVEGVPIVDLNTPAIIEAPKQSYIADRWQVGTYDTYALLDCFVEPFGIRLNMLAPEIVAVTEERINAAIPYDVGKVDWLIEHVIKRYKMPLKITKKSQKRIPELYNGAEFKRKYKEYFE